ncbi:50S ribosomal protein L4 [bacterium]|jgi:large subunit ribosomal protein L4|nr:50S ribosomal protein L4 [bacterium]MBT6832428.1 50S ribosomal protein L4 [bacterium]MBT6996012.1 50S ribosomal protein L4 [bacterium]MBT7772574.1 50S ribosomal protein L4 [bacterium]
MKIDLYSAAGEKAGDVTLNTEIFGAKINEDLMHRAIVMRLANRRTPVAHSLTRGEINATTKKAFRQKGTGRARRGAMSTNIVRGGGVTHGPRNDANYSKTMPKKERRAALFSSLSVQAKEKNIFALEKFESTEPKTKMFADLLAKFPTAKKYLFVISTKNEVFQKSAANVPGVTVVLANYVNPYDVLHAEKVCFLKDALPKIEETFLDKK